MINYYLSPDDVALIRDTVAKVLGQTISNAGVIALENLTNDSDFRENVEDIIGESLISGAAGLTIVYDDSTGKVTLTLDADLSAIATLATMGIIVRTANGAMATRSLIEPTAGIDIANPDGIAGDPTFTLVNDLGALEALSSSGLAARTANDTWALRTLQSPAAGLAIAEPGGVAGNPTFSLTNDLAAVEGLVSTGIAVRTATDAWANRSLQQPASGITITNPAGIAGDPSFALANDLAAIEGLGVTGMVARIAADTWTARTITGTASRITVNDGDGVAGNPTIDLAASGITAGTYAQATYDTYGRATSGTNSVNITGQTVAVSTKTGAYTATSADYALLGNGTFSFSLPAAASNTGRIYAFRNVGAGTITIDPDASEQIDGAATKALAANEFATIVCDGSAWFTIG